MRGRKNKAEQAYLDAVAELGCVICGAPASIHHLRRNPETGSHYGLSQRAPDCYAIPLCRTHHQTGGYGVAIHAGQREWERIHGTEAEHWQRVQERLGRVA